MRKLLIILFLFSLFIVHCSGQVIHPTKYNFGLSFDTTTGEGETPPPSTTQWGTFPLGTDPVLTRAEKIHKVKASGATVMRYNYTVGDVFWAQQILDSGLNYILMYNFVAPGIPGTTPPATLPTDTAAAAAALESFLTAHASALPILICFCNEPSNPNYWVLDANAYKNLLIPAIRISHAHGIEVASGAATFDIVYFILKYYQDNNLTEQYQWLSDASGITNITGPIAQSKIAFYNVTMPFYASNADYFDQHWYEPPRQDTFPTVTCGIAPVVMAFVADLYGLQTITTEIGTRNHSVPLFYAMLNEWKDRNVKYVIYFAPGNGGDLAYDLSDDYAAYLIANGFAWLSSSSNMHSYAVILIYDLFEDFNKRLIKLKV